MHVIKLTKHIRTTNKFRKVAIMEREARSKRGVRQLDLLLFLKRYALRDYDKKLNVCSV